MTVKVVWPSTRGPKFDESPDLLVPILVVRHAGGREVDGMNFEFKSRTGKKISRHVNAFLVLNHENEFQRQQLELVSDLPWASAQVASGL